MSYFSTRPVYRFIAVTLAFFMVFGLVMTTMPTEVYADTSYPMVTTDLGTATSVGGTFTGSAADGFALAKPNGEAFQVFEPSSSPIDFSATVKFLDSGDVAAGLAFGVSAFNWGGNTYVTGGHRVSILPKTSSIRVTNNATRNGYDRTFDISSLKLDYNQPLQLRVLIGDAKDMEIYVDGKLAASDTVSTYTSGKVALYSKGTSANFSNISLKMADYPSLTGLQVADVELDKAFDPAVTTYTANVPVGTASVKLKATVDKSGKVSINGDTVASGEEVEVSLITGNNAIKVDTVTSDGKFTKTGVTVNIYLPYDTDNAYTEEFRPQFHYSPRQNWTNDPNGLMYNATTGEYHMFYQYNPNGTGWGNMSWGHASSKDLVNWTELPPAIYNDDTGMIFSGSGVIDYNNTSGLFPDSVPPASRMVALYTYSNGDTTHGSQYQALAYSLDDGLTWIKYAGNPVLSNRDNMYSGDFRDPKVYWMEDTQQWLMVVAGGDARLFTSPDLINWTHNSNLKYGDGATQVNSECPDLFPLAYEGGTKWVYTAGGLFYLVGDLQTVNGKYQFIPDSKYQGYDDRELMYDGGFQVNGLYATTSYHNDPHGRKLLVSWLAEGSSHSDLLRKAGYNIPWTGSQSVAMVAKLINVNGEPQLAAYPAPEIETLRGNVIYSTTGKTVGEGDANILAGKTGTLLDLEGVFVPGAGTTEFGFKFRLSDDSQNYVQAKYNVATKELTVDPTHTTTANITTLGGAKTVVLEDLPDGKIKLRILLDTSVLDVFGNDGLGSAHTSFYTTSGGGMQFYTVGGNVTVDSLKIWEMEPAMINAEIVEGVPAMQNLTISEGELSPAFHTQTNNYNVTVAKDVESVDLTAFFPVGKLVTGTANGQAINPGVPFTVALENDSTLVTIVLDDTLKKNTYTVTITRQDKVITTKPSGGNKPGSSVGSNVNFGSSGTVTNSGKANPASGDASAIPAALTLLAASGCAAILVASKKKKKDDDK